MMSKSARLRSADQKAIWELVNECRELGDDTHIWRPCLCRGIARLTHAGLAASGEFDGCAGCQPTLAGLAEWGWENGFHRERWAEALRNHQHKLGFSPLVVEYCRRLREEDGIALARTDVLGDREWYRSPYFVEVHSAVGVDHALQCYREIGADRHDGVALARGLHEPDFTPHDRGVVWEAERQIAPLVGGVLAGFEEPSPSHLAPRARQVLACLLDGDSDKQIAARLRISGYTVNQYVKVIFAHFGVQSRPELLARWVKRGWGGRCAWRPEA